jgi:hypothetical protein
MRKNNNLAKIIILLGFYLLSSQLFAGAWTQKKDGYYLRIYSTYLFATQEFNYQGDQQDLYEEHLGYRDSYFKDISIVIYSEYGLTNYFTFIGELPFKSLTTKRTVASFYGGDEIATTSGFADLGLFGKLAILENPLALSIQAGARIPLGYSQEPQNNGPRLGSAEMSYEGHIILGSSFYPLPVYFTGSLGYRYRTGDLHDEVIITAEIGYTLGPIFIKTYVEALRSVVTPPDIYGQQIVTPLPGGGGVLPDIVIGDQHLTKVIPSITLNISDALGIQFEIIEPLTGRNTINGTTYSLGFVLHN